MDAVTLRKIPPKVKSLIEKKKKEKNTSINKAIIELLEECAGVSKKEKDHIYHDLDHLAGTWTENEARTFTKSLKKQRGIDPELWK